MLAGMKLHWLGLAGVLVASTQLVAAPEGPASAPATQPSSSATPFVSQVVGDALRVLGDPHMPAPQKQEQIRNLALGALDFDALARLSMGHYWRGLSDQQQRDFTEAFKQHLINTCCEMTSGFSDEQVTELGEREETHGDRTVQTSVRGKDDNGNKVEYAKVDFRTRQKNGQWKVIDVSTSGVSLLSAFKVQFESLMAVGGYDRVMKMLHDKNAAASASAAGSSAAPAPHK
jgi:phospholipid transport system substrate-binding protein